MTKPDHPDLKASLPAASRSWKRLGKPDRQTSNAERLLRMAQALLIFNAFVWVLLAIASLVRMTQGSMGGTTGLWIIGGLGFANAGGMLWLGLGLGVKPRLYFIPAVAFLLLNILLTVTDQFGLADLLTLLVDLLILALLFSARIAGRQKA